MRNPRKRPIPHLHAGKANYGLLRRNESGVALLLAIFTLLLLTVMGLSLLCAADLETTIAANYRDKQVSLYGSLSGLQEARDRLIPSRCAGPIGTACNDPIAVDTRSMGVPALGDPNSVLYIINPSNSETVRPWDPANPYFDNELCQENILGLTAVPGSCPATSASVPSGTNWFNYSSVYGTTYNNTQSAAGEYQPVAGGVLPFALPYKWIRITVKTDNMTKALVREGADGSIVCWDGKHQIPIGGNPLFNSACESTGAIQLSYNGTLCPRNVAGQSTCTFNPPIGSGYSPSGGNVPVTFSGGGGINAAATAHITGAGNGALTAINVTNGGHDYDVPPTVTITGDGSGATAVATISSSGAAVTGLSGLSQQTPVGCYQNTASVSIVSANSNGSGATATANMSGNTCIAALTLSVSNSTGNGQGQGQGNSHCNGTRTLSVSGGGGSGFEGTITFDDTGKIVSYAITNPGIGYTSDPTAVTVNQPNCDLGATIIRGKRVDSLTLNSGGGNYDTEPIVQISAPTAPAGQNAPTATATLGAVSTGYVSGVTLLTPGSGYTSAATTITFTPAGATGADAAATATISPASGGQIDSITLTNAGTGYTSNPSATIGGGGSGAVVQAKSASATSLGRVYMLTAMAQAPGGSKTMSQMEVATPVRLPISLPGALTLDAFSPVMSPSNSNLYHISGIDANSCGETALPPKASVGVIDNPNSPSSPTAVSCVTSTLGGAPDASCAAASGVKPENYTGAQASPNVENVYEALGTLTTPAGCDTLATSIAAEASYTYTGNLTCNSESNCQIYNSTYPTDCPTIVVNGNLTVGPGNPSLCGVLLVTGTLNMTGDYTWDGPVFVIGKDGAFVGSGGGNGQINGSLFVAQTKMLNPNTGEIVLRPTLGTPDISFNILGGGGNGIYYDHCKSDNMLSALRLTYPPSNKPLKVLSVRSIY